MSKRQQLEELLNNPNAQKMLNLIASAEGVKHGYNTIFGNERFSNLSAHPNVLKRFKQTDGKVNYTTAAGRYQFLKPTWDSVSRQYGLTDFSPRNQDLGALALIKRRGALNDVLKGDYRSAVNKLGKEWASLPSSTYAQPKKSWGQLGLEGNSAKGSRMQKASMNDLHSLFKGAPTIQKANFTGRQLRPGFASDIPPELRNTAPIPQAKKVSAQNSNLASMNDLHSLFTAQKRANFTPPDVSKAADQKVQKEQLKKQGPTQFWESALLGAADVGVPVVQGAEYVADGIRGGINKLFGTNLETDRYEKLTKSYKDIDSAHKTVRKANNQGVDVARIGTNMAMTAPLAAAGGTLPQGAKLASRAGAEFLGKNAAVGALIGATGVHENSKDRLNSMAAGAVGGAIGAAAGQKIGEGIAKGAQKVRGITYSLQSIDEKLDKALQAKGMKLSDLSDDVVNGLRKDAQKALSSGKNLNPEAVARKAVLDRVGIKGTQAQVSGNPKQWQTEAELAKLQGPGDVLRDKFVNDNKQLSGLLESAVNNTGGKAVDQFGAAKNASDALLDQYTQNKQFVSAAYDAARKAPGNEIPLNSQGFVNDAFTALDQNYAASSLPANIQKILKDVNDHPEMFTLGKSEELIKVLNREFKASMQNGQPTSTSHAIGLVRDALNNRQGEALEGLLASGGNDAAQAYQFARNAHKTSIGLRDKMPLLQDALKGVEPDRLFQKHILNGNVNELGETISVLRNANPQAVADIKQQVLLHISGKAVNQNGQFSPAGMKRALDSLGDRKLAVIFEPDELVKIKDIGRAGEYLVSQPAHSYVNNSNSASGLMNYFGTVIKNVGGIGRHVPWVNETIVQPIQGAGQRISATRALNNPSLAGTSMQATPADLSLIEKLVKAGVISGANISNE